MEVFEKIKELSASDVEEFSEWLDFLQVLTPLARPFVLELANLAKMFYEVGQEVGLSKIQAKGTATYFKALVEEGFSREEAMLLVLNTRLVFADQANQYLNSLKLLKKDPEPTE